MPIEEPNVETVRVILPQKKVVRITVSNLGGGGSVSSDASLILNSSGDSNDVTDHPYTADNSGVIVNDANDAELFRIWASDPNFANYNSWNLYVGHEAGLAQPHDNVDAGYENTGVGFNALHSVTTGNANTALGGQALELLTTGYGNVSVGVQSNGLNTTGSQNTAIGTDSLLANETGNNNVAIGHVAAFGAINPESCVFLGQGTDAGISTLANGIAIGAGVVVAASNTAIIGNSSLTDVYFGSTSGAAKIHGKGDAIVFPDSDPHVAGAAYWVAGVLTKSLG